MADVNLKALATRASMHAHKYQTQKAVYAVALLAKETEGKIEFEQINGILGHLHARRGITNKIDRLLQPFYTEDKIEIPVGHAPVGMISSALYTLYLAPSREKAIELFGENKCGDMDTGKREYWSNAEYTKLDQEREEYYTKWIEEVKLTENYRDALDTRNRAIASLKQKCQDLLKAIHALPQMDFSISTKDKEDDEEDEGGNTSSLSAT